MPPFKNKCIVSKKFVKYIKIKWYKYIYWVKPNLCILKSVFFPCTFPIQSKFSLFSMDPLSSPWQTRTFFHYQSDQLNCY